MIRITGGKYKKTKLNTISKYVRPTSSIKREAFFSVLESMHLNRLYDIYNNRVFIDLFAGIGTMGLEAISRGFEYVIFYENNPDVIKILKQNCKKICSEEEYEVVEHDLEDLNINLKFENISVIYIDPPYSKYNISKLLQFLKDKLKKETIIGIESSIKDKYKIPESFNLIKQKKYRNTNIDFIVLT